MAATQRTAHDENYMRECTRLGALDRIEGPIARRRYIWTLLSKTVRPWNAP